MQKKNKNQDRPENAPGAQTRTRRCLMCGQSFQSEWAGERVCKKCKSTTAWRSN